MERFVALAWSRSDPNAARAAARMKPWLAKQFHRAFDTAGLEVWVGSNAAPKVSAIGDVVLIGERFGPLSPALGPPIEHARSLIAEGWGGYVGLVRRASSGLEAVFRDPSGVLDVLVWQVGDLVVAASEPFEELLDAAPPRLAIDQARLAAGLRDPTILAGQPALTGLLGVTPGGYRALGGAPEEMLWRPIDIVRRQGALDGSPQALAACVDGVIAQLATPETLSLVEVSGGLDSAVVAAAVARTGAPVAQWLNYYIDVPAGDERPYARALGEHLGVTITEARKPPMALDFAALARHADGARPGMRVLDTAYDLDLAERCVRLGAGRIFTGLGGDTVFQQGGHGWLGADLCWRRVPGLRDIAPLTAIARRAKRSVWTVLRQTLTAQWGAGPAVPNPMDALLTDAARPLASAVAAHPWLRGLEGAPPVKREQILGLTQTLSIQGGSRRAAVARLVHPLLAQPVVEHCLALSCATLAPGGDDRGLARAAFVDRLAPSIYRRRSKGDFTSYYARMIGEGLEPLRALLLDGELVRRGLIDANRLDAHLSLETLIHLGPTREVLSLVVQELWVRSWTARLARLARLSS